MKKLYSKKTKNTGMGLFTAEPIKKGEYIFTVKGNIVKNKIQSQEDSSAWLYPNCIGINKSTWINPIPDNPLTYVNHSCNPNAGIKGSRKFYAIRDINSNEEITLDYSTSEVDIYWEMNCVCGEPNCRKIIRSIQFLPKKTFEKYLPYIPSYFQKIYITYNKK